MKNIFNLIILLNIFYLFQKSISNNLSGHYRIRNFVLRMIVFKEKKMTKFFTGIKNISDMYYNKVIVTTGEGINKYNELTEEQKTIIEAIISLYY
jgi:hypothetical protein